MIVKDGEVKIKTRWRPTGGEPSAALRRLWGKLLASRKGKPANALQDAREGKCKDENGTNVPNV